jgi:hypothetical protein
MYKKQLFSFLMMVVCFSSYAAQIVDFSVKDVHGDTHKLSDMLNKGQYVVLDFLSHT